MFKNQFSEGIFLSGIEGGRTLSSPMPWHDFAYLTDEDTKAMFAYLKTTKPVRNVVPQAIAPVYVK
jgi:mono/diheme cytochrome c family protein